MHTIPQFDLDVLPFTGYPYICCAEFTKKVQRRSSLLAKGQLQGVFPASLFEGLLHIVGHSIESVGRAKPLYALMGALVVVVPDPVIQPL